MKKLLAVSAVLATLAAVPATAAERIKVGVLVCNAGVTIGGVMTWGVLAVTNEVAPGALAGPYAGVSGNVALGVGVGANVLVGSSNSFALNPVSVEGNVGASLALGVAGLTLTYAP